MLFEVAAVEPGYRFDGIKKGANVVAVKTVDLCATLNGLGVHHAGDRLKKVT